MNILHYSLGFPPYRSGGLTKFCVDLMEQQEKEGHEVSLLWPGEMSFFHGHTSIRNHGKNGVVNSFEVINPTPVSYDEGIAEIEAFMEVGSEEVYEKFLELHRPDVIHIHTLMGLHKSLLTAAKKQKIRIVFTAHDLFPICPKVTMFCGGEICKTAKDCENCAVCNLTALSMPKIRILQTQIYRRLKDSSIVKIIRKQHRDAYLSEGTMVSADDAKVMRSAGDYKQLRYFYKSLLDMVDVIHYNSTVTKYVYDSYLEFLIPKAVVIPITHADIADRRKKKEFGNLLRLTYLGPAGGAKGFFLLRKALDNLWNDRENGRQNFCLNIFFKPVELAPYMIVHGRYGYDQMMEIFENTDVLVAPSIWYETFGYTVLEALSFGVPVIVSDTVGAKDIIPEGAGIIVNGITEENLSKSIMQLDTEQLQSMNEVIVSNFEIPTLASMSELISKECYQ